MSWNEEKVSKLRKYWREGKSASVISEIFGDTSRNAVIGKVHRLGLQSRAPKEMKQTKNDKGKKWTREELDELVRLRKERAKQCELARKFGRSQNAIRLKLETLSIKGVL